MSANWVGWGFFFASALVAAASIAWLLRAGRDWAVDLPNERSLHTIPTPRTGGLALMFTLGTAALTAWRSNLPWPWLATVLAFGLAAMSFLDDRRGLPVPVRLGGHLVAATALVAGLAAARVEWPLPAWALAPLMILGIVAMANFFNFMDGANGLAGGMALSGFLSYALAADVPAALSFTLSGAAAGFLGFNLRGRIFLGDAGSVPLGFLAAGLGASGWLQGWWPWWFPPAVFAPFVADAGVTLLRRMLRGDRFWEAHREHYYQRLVRMGWTHLRLAAHAYPLMILCALAALWARSAPPAGRATILAIMTLCLLACALWIDARWRRFTRTG